MLTKIALEYFPNLRLKITCLWGIGHDVPLEPAVPRIQIAYDVWRPNIGNEEFPLGSNISSKTFEVSS
jgi:hypothetical protein